MVSQYIVVGLGGAIGAVTRIAISRILPSTIIGIPFQLLIINSIGCLAMGILSQLAVSCWITSDNIKYFLMPGVLGGLTTFSGFALDFGSLIEKNEYSIAVSYAILSFGISICCFFLGSKIAKLFIT